MRSITINLVTYRPTEDGDRDVIRSETDVYTFDRTEYVDYNTGRVLGASTAVRQAAEELARNYVRFSNVDSDVYGARWAAADPYESPITDSIEETTAHLGDGWSDSERRAVIRMTEWLADWRPRVSY